MLQEKITFLRREIRRRNIDDLFAQKRRELLHAHEQINEGKAFFDEIYSDNGEALLRPFVMLMEFDGSGGLLQYFSGYESLLDHPLCHSIKERIHPVMQTQQQYQINFNEKLILSNNPPLKKIILRLWEYFFEWSKESGEKYLNLMRCVRRYSKEEELIQHNTLSWMGLLANFLFLGERVRDCLNENNETRMAYRRRTLVERENSFFEEDTIVLCKNTLFNLLAGDDTLLVPQLYLINSYIRTNVLFSDLYYNMFLIKDVPFALTTTLLSSYVRLLEQNYEEFLSHHANHLNVLFFALHNNCIDKQAEQYPRFIGVGERMLILLNNLLKIVNLRYDANAYSLPHTPISAEQPNQYLPIFHLCSLIEELTSHKTLSEALIQTKHVQRMFIAQLNVSDEPLRRKIILCILNTCISITCCEYLSTNLFSKEPLLWIKLCHILKKFLPGTVEHTQPHTQISPKVLLLATLRIFYNLTLCSLFCEQVMEEGLWSSFLMIQEIYYRDSTARGIQLECDYIMQNIFKLLAKQAGSSTETVAKWLLEILRVAGLYQFLVAMLKRSQLVISDTRHRESAHKTLEIFRFLSDFCSEMDEDNQVRIESILGDFLKLDYLRVLSQEEIGESVSHLSAVIRANMRRRQQQVQ